MKVILLKDVPKVGQIHQIKEVSDGFALNSLIPRKLAIPATPQAVAAHAKAAAEKSEQESKKHAQWVQVLKTISDGGVTVTLSADEGGHLYKKLDARTIAQLLSDKGLPVLPAAIRIPGPITTCGAHLIEVSTKEGSGSFTMTVEALSKKRT